MNVGEANIETNKEIEQDPTLEKKMIQQKDAKGAEELAPTEKDVQPVT